MQPGNETDLDCPWWGGSWWHGEEWETLSHGGAHEQGGQIPITFAFESERGFHSSFISFFSGT